MLGWTSPCLLLCEGTSVQKAGAGLSRGPGSLCLFSFSLQLQVEWCDGCNWAGCLAPLWCMFAVALPSLALCSCVPGATQLGVWCRARCRDPVPCALRACPHLAPCSVLMLPITGVSVSSAGSDPAASLHLPVRGGSPVL